MEAPNNPPPAVGVAPNALGVEGAAPKGVDARGGRRRRHRTGSRRGSAERARRWGSTKRTRCWRGTERTRCRCGAERAVGALAPKAPGVAVEAPNGLAAGALDPNPPGVAEL